MAQSDIEPRPIIGTQSSLDYDPTLLNLALTESTDEIGGSTVKDFKETVVRGVRSTDEATNARFPPSGANQFEREDGDAMCENSAPSEGVSHCFSPRNPFAVDTEGVSVGAVAGNTPISDPTNPFYDVTREGEAMDTDAAVVTDAPTTSNNDNQPLGQLPVPAISPSTPHCVKWLLWQGGSIPIATQNENGPCPLLAICNTLLLTKVLTLPPGTKQISSESLAQMVANRLLESNPTALSEDERLNYDRNVQDAITMFPKLQTGLDVNVKFSGVCDFEFTQELVIFDLLNIGLYHGWLADPQDYDQYRVVKNLSYNQLVEKIINGLSSPMAQSPNSATVAAVDASVAENFLNSTASQLTYHGLCELNVNVKENQMCVFFRNNHFSSMYKYKNHLYLLVTDQGYLDEPSIVWEHLSNVEGDTSFVDEKFQPAGRHTQRQLYQREERSAATEGAVVQPREQTQNVGEAMSQEDQDYLMAVTLQQSEDEADAAAEQQTSTNTAGQPTSAFEQPAVVALPEETANDSALCFDRQLALELHREEIDQLQRQRSAYQASMSRGATHAGHRPAMHQTTTSIPRERRNSGCTIL